MQTFSDVSFRLSEFIERLGKWRHIFSGILAGCFFLAVPLQYALLDWIPTNHGTWVILQGKADNGLLWFATLLFSFAQLISGALFLFFGFTTRFIFERNRNYLSSAAYSISYFLAWVQTLGLIATFLLTTMAPEWMKALIPFLPHLWMVIVGFHMFYADRVLHLIRTFPLRDFWKVTAVCFLLYAMVYFFLDRLVTQPVADWFSLELSSWREQNLNQGIEQAGRGGIWILFLQWLFIGCVGPIAEEIFFRGLLQRSITKKWGVIAGISLSALCFACFHVDVPLFAPLFILGLILGWLRHHYQYLWVPIGFHMLNNSVSVLLDII